MSFARKAITVKFTLASGTFNGTNANTLTIPGLRISFTLAQQGGIAKDYSRVMIYGLSQSHMNQMSTYGVPTGQTINNRISMTAGDAGGSMATVFDGVIWDAFADYTAQPDAAFVVTAYSNLYQAVQAADALSYKGTVDAAMVMDGLAQKMGLKLENNGVAVKIASHYSTGSILDQVQECARTGDFNAYPDTVRGVLAIWPKNGARAAGSNQPLLISPQTGLVGYPSYSNYQLNFRSLFNPGLVFGRKIQIKSSITPACGTWIPAEITTTLESERPGGAWFSDVHANSAQFVQGDAK